MTDVEKAQKTFWDGCVQHIRDTYSGLNGKRVYIYGSGEFGRFLAKVLIESECIAKSDLKGFINDFENGFASTEHPFSHLKNAIFLEVTTALSWGS